MPRNPRQSSINPQNSGMSFLFNPIVPFAIPAYQDVNFWRQVAYKQPVVMACNTTLTMFAQSLQWDIRAKDPEKQDELKDKCNKHKNIILKAGGKGYLNHIAFVVSELSFSSFGAGTERLLYSDKELYDIINIDSATLFPNIYNNNFPVIQQVGTERVVFDKDEIVRIYLNPRTEIEYLGWGMSNIQKIYLAIEMLARGDKYYAGLLLDTPEAGLLDLGDMSRESALKWLESFRSLMTGIDGFKIPVLFEHTVPANYIPFGRPPTDMLFSEVTYKYAQLVCAIFGLTTGDIGLKNSNGSLSSDIRDERHTKSTGFASLKNYLLEYFSKILPEDLQFSYIDTDDELLVAKGRARSANAVAMRNFIESGTLTPSEARKQMKADGLISIPLTEDVESEDFELVKDISGLNDQIDLQQQQIDLQAKQTQLSGNGKFHKIQGQGGSGLNKQRNVRGAKLQNIQGKEPTPASVGGQGEIKSVVQDNLLKDYLTNKFNSIKSKIDQPHLRRLSKLAIKNIKPQVKSILQYDLDLNNWVNSYQQHLFGLSEDEIVQKSVNENVKVFSQLIKKDAWWNVYFDESELADILTIYYLSGLEEAAQEIQQELYENGETNELEIKKEFNLSNEKKSDEIYQYAVWLSEIINNGTDYYIERLSLASVLDTLKISEFQNNENLWEDDLFINTVATNLNNNLNLVLNSRLDTISEYEINKMIQKGNLDQYQYVGFLEKRLVHIGADIPCEHCQEQEKLGWVDINFKFRDKFGNETLLGLQHPHCHDQLEFRNLKDKNFKYFTGE